MTRDPRNLAKRVPYGAERRLQKSLEACVERAKANSCNQNFARISSR
jgi:hypothetical protein